LLSPELLKAYTINNTGFILVEFPYTHLPINAGEILFNLILQGLTPIITHPERIPTVMANPDTLLSLLNGNVYVQVTADSLTGAFGDRAKECACFLLQKGAVHFIASDAHSSKIRKPVLSEALAVAEKIIGKEKARLLVEDNPLSVISGKNISI
jgi:protein-tyrosine phosphatase